MGIPRSQSYFWCLAANDANLVPVLDDMRCLDRIRPLAEDVERIAFEMRWLPFEHERSSTACLGLVGASAALVAVCNGDVTAMLCEWTGRISLRVAIDIVREAVSLAASLAVDGDVTHRHEGDTREWVAEVLRTSSVYDWEAFLKAVGVSAAKKRPLGGGTDEWISYAATIAASTRVPRIRRRGPGLKPEGRPVEAHHHPVVPLSPSFEDGCRAIGEALERMEAFPFPYEHAETMVCRLRAALDEALAALEASDTFESQPNNVLPPSEEAMPETV